MPKQLFYFLFLILSFKGYSQKDSLHLKYRRDSLINSKTIFLYNSEILNTVAYNDAGTGQYMGAARSRSIILHFRVGNGYIKNLGKKGKNLKAVIETDTAAMTEFNRAYKHLRKKRIANAIEYLSYAIAIGAIVPIAIGPGDDNPMFVPGIGIAIIGLTGIVVSYIKTEREMDKFRDSIIKCMYIYNHNLKTSIK